MRQPAGALVALVQGRSPIEALAIASPWVPQSWSVRAVVASGGAGVVAGPAVLIQGQRAILGVAVGDPWGLPGRPLDPATVLQRFVRYGDQVVQVAAGPFAVVDFERGRVAAAINGIVPIFVGQGTHSAAGSHAEIVAALAGASQVKPVAPGWAACIGGSASNIADVPVYESLAQVRLAAIDEEIEAHIRVAGRPTHSRSCPGLRSAVGLRVRCLGGALVAAPKLASLGQLLVPEVELADLRARVGRLWWEAGLRGTQVFVPTLERPALDTLALAFGAR